jgi:4-aminobutyrate aminotransferase-like enzyme
MEEIVSKIPAEHKRGSFLLVDNSRPSEVLAQKRKEYHDFMDKHGTLQVDCRKLGQELMGERKAHLGPNVSCFYADEDGLVISYGKGPYMYDLNGIQYLDCCNNVACVGHSEPSVVKAGADALAQIQTNSRFLHPTQQRYIRKLLSTFPPELSVVYLVNSGSEANDLALRIAKAHAENMGIARKPKHVLCLDSGWCSV